MTETTAVASVVTSVPFRRSSHAVARSLSKTRRASDANDSAFGEPPLDLSHSACSDCVTASQKTIPT